MQWMGVNDLRESFLSFYESKGHKRLPSAPLIPQDDKSLLLINSGMAPLKKYFMGQATPPSKRATTCQKCIRTPDIERVGKTSRHGTYFEMLGNFSFGDYFKKEAITWAWEFLTKVLEIPKELLWASTYTDDEQARELWRTVTDIDPSHIVILGKEDNFWEIGSGPCGPCSEIYFDRGPEHGCGKPTCAVGCDCDRYVEIWNLVFTQFDGDGKGNYTPLEHPNIDTGMGLERLACVMQGVDNLFEVDTVQKIMGHIARIAGVQYKQNETTDVSLRVITDHIRSTTFMVGDGVIPSNEGRGYVLRRLLRRAARHGRLLGITKPFLYEVCDTVIAENAAAYPELVEKEGYIKKIIQVEEERFEKTIGQGMELLSQTIDRMEAGAIKLLSGEEAFKLYDTFGFPIDLIREIVQEHKLDLDEAGFDKLMAAQRERARAARMKVGDLGWKAEMLAHIGRVLFKGYDELRTETRVQMILKEGEAVEAAGTGEEVTVILDETPFYGESGGQVGDTGVIEGKGVLMRVSDCKRAPSGQIMQLGVIESGVLTQGDRVTAQVDVLRRRAIMRNHSAAHLLQAALRHVLGDHVHQAGSYVDEHRVRFDFSHFSAMTPDELRAVELEVNRVILEAIPGFTAEMGIEEAKRQGAIALFGEKYGDVVRVVRFGDYSVELCGGTHVANTAELGLFTILSESSVAAGVRRIEGTTGMGVMKVLHDRTRQIEEAAANLKLSNPAELVARAAAVTAELKEQGRKIAALEQKLAGQDIQDLFAHAAELGGLRIASQVIEGAKPDVLRTMGDKIRAEHPDSVVVLVSPGEGKSTVLVCCGKEAVAKGIHAGNLVKALTAKAGGSGGGRPDSAMGGAPDRAALEAAAAGVAELCEGMLK